MLSNSRRIGAILFIVFVALEVLPEVAESASLSWRLKSHGFIEIIPEKGTQILIRKNRSSEQQLPIPIPCSLQKTQRGMFLYYAVALVFVISSELKINEATSNNNSSSYKTTINNSKMDLYSISGYFSFVDFVTTSSVCVVTKSATRIICTQL